VLPKPMRGNKNKTEMVLHSILSAYLTEVLVLSPILF
jgi:hypothetical protein